MIATGLAKNKDLKELSAGLKLKREEAKLDKYELAKKVGISYKHYYNIENAEYWPSMPTYIAICRALGVAVPMVG